MYEETSHQSLDISPVRQHSLDALTQDRIPHFGEDTQRRHEPTTGDQASVSSCCPEQNLKFPPVWYVWDWLPKEKEIMMQRELRLYRVELLAGFVLSRCTKDIDWMFWN